MNTPSLNPAFPKNASLQLLLAGLLLSIAAHAWTAQYYVSQSGNDNNPGTLGKPFRTVGKGVSVLQAGDALNVRGGVYVESVRVAQKMGSDASQGAIVIRSYPGESAYIDGSVSQFRVLGNSDWELARLHDPAAHPDEYVSKTTFPVVPDNPVNQGAFLDRNPYTRLITYSRLEDLRATNETFDKITAVNDSRPGPQVINGQGASLGFRHPWVYMGPGIWFDRSSGKVHIRLSPTHNNIAGLPDYTGEADPRKVRLAIAAKGTTTLEVSGSKFVRFENLAIRYGGQYTILLQNIENVVFDHVRIFAASYGVRSGGIRNSVFRHCEFNGGMPSWFFRTDRKDEYYFRAAEGIELNNLGKQTQRALLLGGNTDLGTTIHNCEFVNAHDTYLVGTNLTFHHNWVRNLNDEGLVLDGYVAANVKIYQNVITKTLSPISFGGMQVGGARYIYRNLVDVREPTAGYRPRFVGDKGVWRYGNTFKTNGEDGPHDIFQNTFLVYGQPGQASYLHYRNTAAPHSRRSFNNIFVAVNPDTASDVSISFLPPPTFPAASDGNDYFRLGRTSAPLLRFLGYSFGGQTFRADDFASLAELRSCPATKPLFCQKAIEANSLATDPRFRRITPDGIAGANDDLRLSDTSPVLGTGVVLPADLRALDPLAPTASRPDMGAYPRGAGSLKVGVDSRRAYPSSP
jgi:hypothetical protein